MTKFFTSTFSIINLYRKNSVKSEIVTQLIYGESFSIIKRFRGWLKIKIKEDGYTGYIKDKKFESYIKPSHKIKILKAKIYKSYNTKKKTYTLSFGSKIRITDKKLNFLRFKKGWIKKENVKSISFKEKNPFSKIGIFKNIKYKWGGKSFKGIDCSALIQIFLNFNMKYCPRDAKDQVKYFTNNIKLNKIKKNDIIYWKGHVALALNKKKLIHAYGPMKKTVIMNIKQTIERINKTANLKVISIKRL
tara:strand:- start:191 stop:931 length:741 start_codon:yes stop_codon:yes gene_type:complete